MSPFFADPRRAFRFVFPSLESVSPVLKIIHIFLCDINHCKLNKKQMSRHCLGKVINQYWATV